jgi:hypothetical protein
MLHVPEQIMSIERSRAMFARVLSAWASDMLVLRSRGLDRPSARRTRGAVGDRDWRQERIRKAA